MNRQNINIANFEFICDLYTAEKDYAPIVYKEFVIIRNIDFINNIACDTDIYFLEKTLFEQIKESKLEKTDIVAFPCYNSNFGSFSTNYTDFASMLDKSTFDIETNGGNIFSLYKFIDGEYTNKNVGIKCDKIKIYHPHNKTDLNYVIYLDNVINGIHFHYFCNYNTNCETYAENEFRIHNNIYSEYIELYIPNINDLFSRHEITVDANGNKIDNNIYFNDFYNITKYIDEVASEYKKEKTWISYKNVNSLFNENDSDDNNIEMLSMLPTYLLLNPFIISTNSNGTEEKIYFRLSVQETNNYNTFPINITLYPYEFSTVNDILLMDSNYPANSDTYVKDYYFKLVSKLGFSHGQLCVLNNFLFNNKYDEVKNPEGLSTQEAYAKYNGLTIEKDEKTGEWKCPLYEKLFDYRKYDIKALKEKLKNTYDEDECKRLKELIELREDADESDIYDEECFIKCCGYQIDIATDFKFTNIIASDYKEMRFIDDFEFSLLNVFDNWYTLPGTLIARIRFIDKYLGVVINTGNILLTKEWLKYSINSINTPRLYTDFIQKQNDLTDNMSWSKIDSKNTSFNFIDKINCIVKRDSENEKISNNMGSQGIKVIYKPIFYKTQQLQTISLTAGFKQKIGINLSQYMTKVNIFKLVIEDIEISEYGRNDIYVIFEINSSDLTNATGTYSIVDYNDNYISSGTYIVS